MSRKNIALSIISIIAVILIVWAVFGRTPQTSDETQTMSWNDAEQLILSGNIESVTQLHDLTVYIRRDDGVRIQTTEPRIDEVFDVLQECGEACSDVVVATE